MEKPIANGSNGHGNKYRALPVQLIEIPGGVILKRGCTEIHFSGVRSNAIVRQLLHLLRGKGATQEEILSHFQEEKIFGVEQLFNHLVRKQIVISDRGCSPSTPCVTESALDIFYWHFGTDSTEIKNRVNERCIGIFGKNLIAHQLADSLKQVGISNFEIIDHPLLRNKDFVNKGQPSVSDSGWSSLAPIRNYEDSLHDTFHHHYHCVVVTSDFGVQKPLVEWNARCVAHNTLFFPIFIQNLVGFAGPLVIPRQTPCFACLRTRQDSNMENPSLMRTAEGVAWEGQSIVGFHPSMPRMLGEIAAFELTKFFGVVLPKRNIGKIIELNLVATTMMSRTILKVPRCPVCSPLLTRASPKYCHTPGHNTIHARI
jgi:molybdopterin-synthase adenylyltransferase